MSQLDNELIDGIISGAELAALSGRYYEVDPTGFNVAAY